MKRIFYFAIAAFAATAVMVSCEKDEPKDPNGGGNGNEDDPTKTEKLAAPSNFNGTVNGDDLTITWDAVENAASYSYAVDNSEPATVTEPSVTLSVEALEYGDHTIFVTALPEDGSEQYTASDEASWAFTLSEPVTMPEAYADYVGTWTLTSTQRVKLPAAQGESAELLDEPVTKEVTIAWDEQMGVLTMTGFSQNEEILGLDLPMMILPEQASETPLYMCGGIGMGLDLSQVNNQLAGCDLYWLAATVDNGQVSLTTSTSAYPVYEMTLNEDGTISATALEIEYNDGTTSTPDGIDLFIWDGGQMLTFFMEYMPAGDYTLTKTGNNAPAPATSVSPLLPVTMTLTSNALSSMMASPIAR